MHGVPTPVNEVLRRAANTLAREGRRPGGMTAGELAALVS
jgi:2-dehydropantoate 2-reductase